MQISDFILAISQNLIFYLDYGISDSHPICQIQAFLMEYGVLATVTWSCIISTLMFLSFYHESHQFEKKEHILILIGFIIPGVVAVML